MKEIDVQFQQARDAGLKCLSAAPRSVHEVRVILRRKGFSEEVVERTIADLERWRLLDDRRLARDWVESRVRRRPASSDKLAQELQQRGIAPALVEEVLAEFGEELDSVETAKAVLRRQQWRYIGLEETRAKRRMLGLLARRGYESEIAQTAIEAVWEELQPHEGARD